MRQHLLVDGDDTLWENNVYVERTIAAFLAFLDHSTLTTGEERYVLDEMERMHGYGSAAFARSMEPTYRRLVERAVHREDIARVHAFGDDVRSHPMEVQPGVEETLS